MTVSFAPANALATPILLVDAGDWATARARLPAEAVAFAEAMGFEPRPGRHIILPGPRGALGAVIFVSDDGSGTDRFAPGRLASLLPKGTYRFESVQGDAETE